MIKYTFRITYLDINTNLLGRSETFEIEAACEFDAFHSIIDVGLAESGDDEEPEPIKEEKPTRKKKKEPQEIKVAKKDEVKPEEPQEEVNFEDMSDDELAELMAANDIDGEFESNDTTPTEEAPVEEEAPIEEVIEEEPQEYEEEPSDEEINEEEPQDEETPGDEEASASIPEESQEEPITDPVDDDDDDSDDGNPDEDFEDMSDDELEALLKNNGMI